MVQKRIQLNHEGPVWKRSCYTPHYQYSTFMQGMTELHGKEALWSELHGWRDEVTSSKLTTGHTNSVFVGSLTSRKLRSLSVCTD